MNHTLRAASRRLCLLAAGSVLVLTASHAVAQEPTLEPGSASTPRASDASSSSSSSIDLDAIGSPERISRVTGPGGGGPTPGRVPEVHTVKQGDTLWDITSRYYRNPYLWPAIWSYNPHITNPHWIYPGDLVFLHGGKGASGNGSASLLGAFAREAGIMVMSAGYYTEDDLAGAGRLVFSPEEKRMLTHLDEAWIDFADINVRKKVPVGLRMAILHPMEAVVDPETDEEIAHKLLLVGTLRVDYNDGKTLPTAVITDAVQEIERGDILLPLEDSLFRLVSSEATRSHRARIIDAFVTASQFGEQMFVLVNRGTRDGIAVGNRFVVVEQREGIYDLPQKTEEEEDREKEEREARGETDEQRDERERQEKTYSRPGDVYWPRGEEPISPEFPKRECHELSDRHDDNKSDQAQPEDDEDQDDDDRSFHCSREYALSDLPYRRIGEVIVVKATEEFSTVLILDSRREINIGHEVILRAGY